MWYTLARYTRYIMIGNRAYPLRLKVKRSIDGVCLFSDLQVGDELLSEVYAMSDDYSRAELDHAIAESSKLLTKAAARLADK